jgi:hypothetical protein
MPPTILSVRGPEKIFPNHVAVVEAVLSDGWTAPQKAQISWRLELEGKVVGIREDVGPVLQMAIPAVAAGRRGRVVPFHAQLGNGPALEGQVEPAETVEAAETTEAAPAPTQPVAVQVRKDAKKWFAKVDGGAEFVVGQEFKFGSRLGLFNSADPIGPFYKGTEWEGDFGLWARMLEPTAAAEGEGSLVALNTWDGARFTFGFVQFAAHTPNENFVLLLRKLLALPLAARYFPDLSLAGGRIRHATKGALETSASTAALQDYFNPTSAAIDQDEVGRAGRLIHWTRADPAARRVQVETAVEKMKAYLLRRAADIEGLLDVPCFLCFDIALQGRAQSYAKQVVPALKSQNPENALLEIGADKYPGRIKALQREIKRLRDAGVLGRNRYAKASQGFVKL